MSRQRQITPSGFTILVVDDQQETLLTVGALLRSEGHRVLTAESGAAALALLGSEPIHLVLLDYFMPVMTGEHVVHAIRERDPLVQIILQTGYAGEKPPREMLRHLAIQGYHDKSDGPERLLLWVDSALKASAQLVRLQAAEQLKNDLLANVSHEFRTPLNVILGYAELLRDGAFGPCPLDAQAVVDKVAASAQRLLALVEDCLDLARLEAGAMPLRRERLDLGTMLPLVVDDFRRRRDVNVVLRLDVGAPLPAIAADARKLGLVLDHLLSNAVRFTTCGEVIVTATASAAHVTVAVRDTGPGIAPEHHEAIFDLFAQLEPHDGRESGLGLGLPLARRLARLMGGELRVESAPGAGSTFLLALPVAGTVVPARAARPHAA
jgi:signal transduction histidine kinase